MQSPETVESAAPAMSIRDYFRTIVRRRRIFFLTFCLIVIGVTVYTYQLEPIYEASTTLRVRDESGNRLGLAAGSMGIIKQSNIDTELEIIRSYGNVEQAVQLLHLNWDIDKKSSGLTFTLVEFQTPKTAVPYTITLTGPEQFIVKDDTGVQIGAGKNNIPFKQGNLSLLLTDLKGKPGDSFQVTLQPLEEIVTGMLLTSVKAIEVGGKSTSGGGTGIIKLSIRNPSPVRARAIANTLAQVYVEQSITFKSEEARKTLEFIEEQMKVTQGAVNEAESRLQQFKSTENIFDLASEVSQLVDRLAEIDKQKSAIQFQKRLTELGLANLKESLAKGQIYIPTAMMNTDTAIGSFAGRLVELDIQKKTFRLEKAEEHPQVRAVQLQIDETMRKLRNAYESNLRTLAKQEQDLEQQKPRFESELKKFPEVELRLAGLTRVSKVNVDIYLFLLQKHEEARIAKAATVSNITIIDSAQLPRSPVYPNKQKNIIFGIFLGLLIGGGLVFFIEYLDDTIKDGEEARHFLGLPVLATVPFIKLAVAQDENESPAIITYRNPKASVAEAFRSLRTSIHFSSITKEKKVLLITSSFPGEGKTTIMSNLAVTMTQTGAKVLLIDCDMRRPSLHKIFKQEKVPGLSEILAGDMNVSDIIHETEVPGLYFIPAGTTPPNPAELLGSQQMHDMLEVVKLRFDHILLDAPPFLAVTDAPLLTMSADIILLVLESERVPVKTAQRTVEMLSVVKTPVAGIILNDKTGLAERYGYYGNKYYASSYYGYGYYGYQYYGEDDKRSKKQPKKWWKKFIR
jgi:tyrosine-protein kinase Etk/Wzc